MHIGYKESTHPVYEMKPLDFGIEDRGSEPSVEAPGLSRFHSRIIPAPISSLTSTRTHVLPPLHPHSRPPFFVLVQLLQKENVPYWPGIIEVPFSKTLNRLQSPSLQLFASSIILNHPFSYVQGLDNNSRAPSQILTRY